MKRVYRCEDDIRDLVEAFESATISRDEWKHGEHLVVGMYYLCNFDLDTATARMRSGILNLLENGFKVDLKKEMPFHETLTVFWMRTIFAYLLTSNGASMAEKANELVALFDKDYPLRFYSRERLFGEEARVAYIDGDI